MERKKEKVMDGDISGERSGYRDGCQAREVDGGRDGWRKRDGKRG